MTFNPTSQDPVIRTRVAIVRLDAAIVEGWLTHAKGPDRWAVCLREGGVFHCAPTLGQAFELAARDFGVPC